MRWWWGAEEMGKERVLQLSQDMKIYEDSDGTYNVPETSERKRERE